MDLSMFFWYFLYMCKKFSNDEYILALSSNYNIGSKSIFKLIKIFDDLSVLWKSPEILNKIISKDSIFAEIVKTIKTIDIDHIKANLTKLNINYITYFDKSYPTILKEISDPPAILYYKGKLPKNSDLCFGVVGSRKYTSYGKNATCDIVSGLSKSGLIIVSGLALGIDAIAHKKTLDVGGKTLAVLGCGLDMIYPSSNVGLANQIIQSGGAIISEYPPKIPPYKSNFVLRNRIIAGLSLGILVVEAAKKSGTLLTARAAMDYNREVFAVPGSIYSYASEGANNLIKYGASPAMSYLDILSQLNIQQLSSEKRMQEILPDNKFEKIILDNMIGSDGIHIDKLSKICDFNISDISSHLTLMEMKGKVRNLGGNIYIISK